MTEVGESARERKALRGVIGGVLCNASNFPAKVGVHVLGRDMGPLIDRTADSILAAGYTKPRTVTTVEELDALPVGSVVRQSPEDGERIERADGSWEQGAVAELRLDISGRKAWFPVGSALGYRSHQADMLPATVLFTPSTEGIEA